MNQYPDSVVLFVVDGMRPDGLRKSSTPVMNGLVRSGASTLNARTVMPSITLPCIASLFLGTTPDTHDFQQIRGLLPLKYRPVCSQPSDQSMERRLHSITGRNCVT